MLGLSEFCLGNLFFRFHTKTTGQTSLEKKKKNLQEITNTSFPFILKLGTAVMLYDNVQNRFILEFNWRNGFALEDARKNEEYVGIVTFLNGSQTTFL